MQSIQFASQIARYVFWVIIAGIIAFAVPEALSTVAGQETVFNFNFAVSASVALSVVTTGAAAGLYLKNRQLNKRVSELEAERPTVTPQAERLPLPEDGG